MVCCRKARSLRGLLLRAGSVVVPVERCQGGADYRDAFRGPQRSGAAFEADVPMTLAALLDHMEQRSGDVLGDSADRRRAQTALRGRPASTPHFC